GIDDATPLFVAGSTAPGEEAPVLRALEILRSAAPAVRLILAPRHPEDFAAASKAAAAAGHRVAAWSGVVDGTGGRAAGAARDVLVLDAGGVLPRVYAAADLVFVGGSLVPRGGQNVLEPAAQGRPVVFGPHTENFRAIAGALVSAGGGFVAHDAEEIGS